MTSKFKELSMNVLFAYNIYVLAKALHYRGIKNKYFHRKMHDVLHPFE